MNIQMIIVLQLSYTLICCRDIKCVLFVHTFTCGKLIEYFLVLTYFILQIFIASLNVTFFCLYGLVRIFACYVLSPYF